MSNDAFDKKLRAKLTQLPPPPTAHLWEGVAAQLPEKSGWRRRGFFWFFLAILLPATTWLFWPSGEETNIMLGATANPQTSVQLSETGTTPTLASDQLALPEALESQHLPEAGDQGKEMILGSDNTQSYFPSGIFTTQPSNADKGLVSNTEFSTVPGDDDSPRDQNTSLRQATAVYNVKDDNDELNLEAGWAPWPARKTKADPGCPSVYGRSTKMLNFFGEVNAGLFLPFRRVEGPNTNLPSGVDSFSSTTSPQVSVLASAMGGVYLTPNTTLKAGLQYSRWHEKFSYNNKAYEETITIITIRSVVLPTGDSVYISDTSTQTIIGNRRIQSTNVYQNFDIPVILGLEFGSRTRFSANVGAVANIRTSYSGYVSDSLGKPVEIKNDGELFKKSMGWGIHAGLGIMYPLHERSSIIIEPHTRIQLTNATSDKAAVKQRWVTGGVQVGWRYNF